MGVLLNQSGYLLGSVYRISPNVGFQFPREDRFPQMHTLSPNLVSHVAANSILKVIILLLKVIRINISFLLHLFRYRSLVLIGILLRRYCMFCLASSITGSRLDGGMEGAGPYFYHSCILISSSQLSLCYCLREDGLC